MCRKWKGKIPGMIGMAVSILFISGCGGAELENKTFPLAVVIAQQDGQHQICYLAQQLSEVANERADGGNMTAADASGTTYYETHKTFEKNNRCQLDMTHTKAVIFQKGFLESKAFPLFLDTVRSENTYARNTLVYLSDSSMDELAELNSTLEVPLGSYLEQMTENEQEMKEQAFVTLGALLNEQANASRTLLLPVLEVERGLPVITSYEALQGFEAKGRVGLQEAQIYFLLAGQLKQTDVYLDEREQVRLSKLKCKRRFILNDATVTQQLVLTADAERVTGNAAPTRIEDMLQDLIEKACRLEMDEKGVDLTDSSRYLALYAPNVYQVYGRKTQEYRNNLVYEGDVQVRVL